MRASIWLKVASVALGSMTLSQEEEFRLIMRIAGGSIYSIDSWLLFCAYILLLGIHNMRNIRVVRVGLGFLFLTFLPALYGATVTWIGGSGDWNTATNWSIGALPGTNDNVVIGAGASITVTHSAGTHTVNSVQSQQAFVLSGGSLTVSNTFQASNTFTLSGGMLATATVVMINGAWLIVSGSSGTLNGVTVNGVLDVGNSYNTTVLTVTNGLVLNGTALVGNPTNYP